MRSPMLGPCPCGARHRAPARTFARIQLPHTRRHTGVRGGSGERISRACLHACQSDGRCQRNCAGTPARRTAPCTPAAAPRRPFFPWTSHRSRASQSARCSPPRLVYSTVYWRRREAQRRRTRTHAAAADSARTGAGSRGRRTCWGRRGTPLRSRARPGGNDPALHTSWCSPACRTCNAASA